MGMGRQPGQGLPKVLIAGILPPPYSGCEISTECLLNCGLDKHFEMRFVSVRTVLDPSSRGKFSVSNLFSMLRVWLRLLGALLVFRPGVAHLTLAQNKSGFLKWWLLAKTCRLFGVGIVSRLGGGAMDRFHSASGARMKRLIHNGLKLSDVTIVQGEALKAQFRGLIGDDRLAVVPSGFDLDKWREGMSPRKPDAKSRVLFIGQVSKAKGVFDLLHAIVSLREQGVAGQYEFVVAGPVIERELNILHIENVDSTSDAINDIVEQGQIREYVRFAGEVSWDEKRRLYAWADIVVLPSYSEGFPNVVLEAFASGCAVICTPVGALPDYLGDGREALFVPPGSPADIASALRELGDAGNRGRLANNAEQYLVSNHGLDTFARRMGDVFNAVLNAER